MTRLRWRLARWLVGPFVQLPDRKGAWIVMRYEGGFVVTIEADKLRLRMETRMRALDDPSPVDWNAPRSSGRFVGTVKGR